jgi:hypothetical protein
VKVKRVYAVMRMVRFDDFRTNIGLEWGGIKGLEGCTAFVPIFDDKEKAKEHTMNGKYRIQAMDIISQVISEEEVRGT